jgi:ComF family protein
MNQESGRAERWRPLLRQLGDALFGRRRCRLCAGPAGAALCAACRDELPWNRVACTLCARPLAGTEAHRCARCSRRPPPFDAALAAFRYAAPIDRAVHALKYHARFDDARWLADALAEHARAHCAELPHLLIPVPLHHLRLRVRGYNQAHELAWRIGRALRIEAAPSLARRLRATADQIGQTAPARRRNVRGAFAVDPAVRGRHLALIDDVMTTGSTLAELARACRQAGAARIEAWVIARAE